MESSIQIIALITIFAGGFTQGLTGFGFSMVTVTTLLIFLPPATVVPVAILLSILLNLMVLVQTWKFAQLKKIWLLALFGVSGVPLGIFILKIGNTGLLKTCIGIIITIFAFAFLKGFSKPIKNEKAASVIVGFISGVFNGSTSLSGPPLILFYANQGIKKHIFRANLVSYFTLLNFFTVPIGIANGIINKEIFHLTLQVLPALALGTILGIFAANKVEEKLFRKIALSIVIVTGIISTITGIQSM